MPPPPTSGDLNIQPELCLQVTTHSGDAGHVLHPYTKFEVRSPSRSEDMANFRVTALINLVALTFHLSSRCSLPKHLTPCGPRTSTIRADVQWRI